MSRVPGVKPETIYSWINLFNLWQSMVAPESECALAADKLRVKVISAWRGLDTIGSENGKGRIFT